MKKLFLLIALIFTCLFTSCVTANVEKIDLADYGVFDAPDLYKSSADGMIDSTKYYYSYNSYSNTVTESKTGWIRMTSKPAIRTECLKKACKFSTESGFDYIVIFYDDEQTYQSGSDIRYRYQILFLPISKDEVKDYKEYIVYRNTLYYKPTSN